MNEVKTLTTYLPTLLSYYLLLITWYLLLTADCFLLTADLSGGREDEHDHRRPQEEVKGWVRPGPWRELVDLVKVGWAAKQRRTPLRLFIGPRRAFNPIK